MTLSDNTTTSGTMESYAHLNESARIIDGQEWQYLWPIMWKNVPYINKTR